MCGDRVGWNREQVLCFRPADLSVELDSNYSKLRERDKGRERDTGKKRQKERKRDIKRKRHRERKREIKGKR